MLAAETTPVDGHLAASTPRRRGMNCKSKPSANKKLVQARLPFKRLNPEPKDNELPKRPSAPACVEPGVSDGENENGSSPSVFNGPPLVNGQGPLDCFFSHKKPASSNENIIDLTEDGLSSPAKRSDVPVSRCTPTKDKTTFPEKLVAEPTKSENDDCIEDEDNKDMDTKDQSTISLLETTQESDGEQGEQNESGNISSFGNHSMLSATSHSSLSDSSPEKTKTDEPATVPTKSATTPDKSLEQKQVRRRSSKSLKEQQERLRLREEKERLKEEAKAAKEKKRQEIRRLKEEKEKERREKKERDEREKREKKEREEKEKAEKLKAKEEQRKSKLEAIAEQKRKKEEEKKMKEEEKRVKEEEKRMKEEKDRLKAEKAEITRFLQKHKTLQSPKTLATACGKFAPFEIKDNMCMAPLCRVQCENSVLEELDQYLLKPSDKLGGIKGWISQKPRRSGPTRPKRPKVLDNCIQIHGPKAEGVPDRKHYGSMKLLHFHENYRPAYWGTWTKKSSVISARCPLKQDKVLLDYEVDSDEEWEEEEPGESLSHSEGEDEEEGGEDDEDDDGFFVPHGYLSDDEGALEEEDGGDLEKQKLQQKLRAREWDELMSTKKKMKVLEPVVRGCHWEGEDPGLDVFQSYAMVLVEPLPKADNSPSPDAESKKSQREEQLLRKLLPLLHGNFNSSKVIIHEFQEFCRQETTSSSPSEMLSPQSPETVPARKLKRLIKNNAVYEKRSAYRRPCWYVYTEVLARWGMEALPVPCQWTYITTGAREEPRDESQAATGSHGNSPTTPQTSSATASSSKRKSTGSMSITKFMKRCNDPEQRVATDTDGFQADAADDEEDCMIVEAHSGPTKEKQSMEESMEVAPSETAALPESNAAMV
ncbi:chromatin assembly factor 1 subunit A isoform X4 [Synchiropus splendidus]|uniref:chromatin assembly factor 1 subunit A isoform X4 n=2 Tax=Synchiropus splendidus TaxID=270530 RepID=UPI00237DEBDC|nr:chromatin assembly factor 1 subunit A isoform X4 [Synchiropus splendidus]